MLRPELAISLALCAVSAAVEADAIAYAGVLDYHGDTQRVSGRLAGTYGSLAWSEGLLVELGVESVVITSEHGPDIRQHDVTLLAGLHPTPDATARLGCHIAWNPVTGSPSSRSVLADASQTGTGGWWSGLGVAVSHFTVTEPEVYAAQAAPRCGWSGAVGDSWRLDQAIEATAIGLDRDTGFGRHHYLSASYAIGLRHGPVRVGALGWAGGRCYHVAQGGFVVYDLPALYRHGYSADLACDLWRGAWLDLQAGRETFISPPGAGQSQVDRLILTLCLTF
jgi:hypothetical protein